MKTSLYRHFSKSGDLLYVGITANLPLRLAAHQCKSDWFCDVEQVTVEWFNDRTSARIAEGRAIRKENPKFNILNGSPEPRAKKQKSVDGNRDTFMKVRVTKQEQAEWRDICRALGLDFSAVVRDTMKRRAASLKRKQEIKE
jgi:predicted GIY-YIG superfamily endonuclease